MHYWQTKLPLLILFILPWLHLTGAQPGNYTLLSSSSVIGPAPSQAFQLGDQQIYIYQDQILVTNLMNNKVSNISESALYSGGYNAFALSSQNNLYCITSNFSVIQVDPLNSFQQVTSYGGIGLGNWPLYFLQGDNIVMSHYEGDTPIQTFNMITSQFECSTNLYMHISAPVIRYGEGYVVYTNFEQQDSNSLLYYACNGTLISTVAINIEAGGNVTFLNAFNTSSIAVLVTSNGTMQAASAINNQTGPIFQVNGTSSVTVVNDTHFIAITNANSTAGQFVSLCYVNSELEITVVSSINLPYQMINTITIFQGNNTVFLSGSPGILFDYIWIDLNSFLVLQVESFTSSPFAPYLPVTLGNGSVAGFTSDGYYVLSEGVLTFNSCYLVNVYIDPTNDDYIWLSTYGPVVVMIQKSTSRIVTIPLQGNFDSGRQDVVSASYDGGEGYNITLKTHWGSSVSVCILGVQQATITVIDDWTVFSINYQTGSLSYLAADYSLGYIYERVYNFTTGDLISSQRVCNVSVNPILSKISDEYAILAVSENSTEVSVYSFSQSKIIFTVDIPITGLDMLIPLGVNLNSASVAQAFAIVSGNNQNYTVFDNQGAQVGDQINFPSGYGATVQIIDNSRVPAHLTRIISHACDPVHRHSTVNFTCKKKRCEHCETPVTVKKRIKHRSEHGDRYYTWFSPVFLENFLGLDVIKKRGK